MLREYLLHCQMETRGHWKRRFVLDNRSSEPKNLFQQTTTLPCDDYHQVKMRSPANLNRYYSGHSVPDLDIVSQRLMTVQDDRDPKPFVDLARPLTESPKTPPYPNPLNPLEYWRVWSQVKAQQLHLMDRCSDYRSLIADFEYWRTEAEFLASEAVHSEERRLQIRDIDYWRIESLYWFNAWMRKDMFAQRRDIDDPVYWRCEAAFWTQTIAFTREDIVDAKYWQTENDHYNLQFDSLAVDTTSPSQLTTSNTTSTAPSSRPPTKAPSPAEAMQPMTLGTQQRRSSRLRARTQRADNATLNEDESLSKRRKRKVR